MKITLHSFKAFLPCAFSLSLVACSSNDSAQSTEEIQWGACVDVTGFECASLSVPLNYSEPAGAQIDIAISRLPASGGNSKGSILFNFGGFGGGGIEELQIRTIEDLIPESISQAHDLVGFDPRGVAGSTIVDCSEQGAGEENPYPASAEQIAQLVTDYEQVATDCQAKYGEYLQHLGSINVVRDMDAIRKALGEDVLNFYGASAGTRIAAVYLQEFPESSGRFVLDASLRPTHAYADELKSALPIQQSALLAGLSECSEQYPQCDEQQLSQQLGERAKALALEGSVESMLELQIVNLVVGVTQENPELWPFVAQPVVNYINTLDVAGLLALIREFEDFDDPAELFQEDDPGIIAERAIVCADDATRPTATSLLSTLDELNQLSNYFAESSLAIVASCAGWPEALEPLAPVVTSTAPAALVIGGSSDVLTPPEWSAEMATQIGGVYLNSDHDGHTGLFDEKSGCLESLVSEFFLEGTIPTVDGAIPSTDTCDET